jgi:hypothetical protein
LGPGEGIHLLPDGTIVGTPHATDRKHDGGGSIVSVQCKISQMDAMNERAPK